MILAGFMICPTLLKSFGIICTSIVFRRRGRVASAARVGRRVVGAARAHAAGARRLRLRRRPRDARRPPPCRALPPSARRSRRPTRVQYRQEDRSNS